MAPAIAAIALAITGTAAVLQAPPDALGPHTPGPAPSQPVTRCETDAAARALGIDLREWTTTCLDVDAERRVVAAVPLAPLTRADADKRAAKGEPPTTLVLALLDARRVVWRDRRDLLRDAAPEIRDVLDRSDELLVSIDPQPL